MTRGGLVRFNFERKEGGLDLEFLIQMQIPTPWYVYAAEAASMMPDRVFSIEPHLFDTAYQGSREQLP